MYQILADIRNYKMVFYERRAHNTDKFITIFVIAH